MNWAALSVVVGLIGLAISTMPWGIVILAGLVYLCTRG
jgi:hypothetical protein